MMIKSPLLILTIDIEFDQNPKLNRRPLLRLILHGSNLLEVE